jgi:hypothetical protein
MVQLTKDHPDSLTSTNYNKELVSYKAERSTTLEMGKSHKHSYYCHVTYLACIVP